MTIREAQEEMRRVYVNGAVGSFVSGAIWLASAALAATGSRNQAVLALVLGGMFIFPLTLLALRLLGRSTAVRKENPLSFLAMQVAFTIPLAIPLVLAAMQHRPEWFYSGFLIVGPLPSVRDALRPAALRDRRHAHGGGGHRAAQPAAG